MTTHLTIKHHKVTLTDNRLGGDTYAVKDYIKAYLAGKWDSVSKTWIVDVDKVNDLLATHGAAIHLDSAPAADAGETPHTDRWYVNTRYGRELAEDC